MKGGKGNMRGQGRIFTRANSPYLWISYYVRGREYRESSHSTEKKDAERLLRHRLREAGADRLGARTFVGPKQERVTVGDLLDALESDYRLRNCHTTQVVSHAAPIRRAFSERRAIQITEEDVDRYIDASLAAGKFSAATINRQTQLLSQAYKLAIRRKVLTSAPTIRRLSEIGNIRQGFFEDADFKALVGFLPEHLRDFARFAYLTGWRKGEISSLRWRDVDREGRSVHLRPESSKNRTGRVVALEGELWNIVERCWVLRATTGKSSEIHLSEYVFHRKGRPIGYIHDSWNLARKRAGLEGRLFHDLRRTAVRNMIRAGVPETVAMKISGHRSRAMFDRYNITSESDLREAIRKTEHYLETSPSRRTVVQFGGAKKK